MRRRIQKPFTSRAHYTGRKHSHRILSSQISLLTYGTAFYRHVMRHLHAAVSRRPSEQPRERTHAEPSRPPSLQPQPWRRLITARRGASPWAEETVATVFREGGAWRGKGWTSGHEVARGRRGLQTHLQLPSATGEAPTRSGSRVVGKRPKAAEVWGPTAHMSIRLCHNSPT